MNDLADSRLTQLTGAREQPASRREAARASEEQPGEWNADEQTQRGAPSLPPLAPLPVTPRRAPPPLWARLRLADWLALGSLLIVALVALAATSPSLLAPFLPTDMSDAVLSPPSREHWLGSDQFGRDVLSLVVYGARQSVLMGVGSVLLSCLIGVSLGILAGYFGGRFDAVLMRSIDVWMSIPSILLSISLSAALGPSWFTTILCVSVAFIPRYARVLRAQALGLRSRPYILAARAAGASHVSILRRHILPHCSAPIVVIATLGIGQAILLGSSLSFLGLGVNDERPDWGYLLTQGRSYLTVAWWTVTYPGLAITALVISVNLIGDALRRWLDPRSVQYLVLARRARRS